MFRFATVFAFALILTATVSARVLYVATDGSGDYTTPQAAVSASVNGDTTLVIAGDYGSTTLTLSSRSNIVLAGSGFNTVPTTATKVGTVNLTNCTNCEVWSLWIRGTSTISGTGNSIRRCYYDGTYGSSTLVSIDAGAQNTLLFDNIYNPGDGTLLSLGGTGTISGCVFTHQSYYSATGIITGSGLWGITNCVFLNLTTMISGTGPLDLRNNIFWSVSTLGIQTYSQTATYNASNMTVPGEHNIVISQTPFANYTNGTYTLGSTDLHLTSSTTCWDNGDPYIHDRYGRGHSTTVSDIGCYGGMTPLVDLGIPPFPTLLSLNVTPVVQVGDSILIQTVGRTSPRY